MPGSRLGCEKTEIIESQSLLSKSLWLNGAERQRYRSFPDSGVNLEIYTSSVHPNSTPYFRHRRNTIGQDGYSLSPQEG